MKKGENFLSLRYLFISGGDLLEIFLSFSWSWLQSAETTNCKSDASHDGGGDEEVNLEVVESAIRTPNFLTQSQPMHGSVVVISSAHQLDNNNMTSSNHQYNSHRKPLTVVKSVWKSWKYPPCSSSSNGLFQKPKHKQDKKKKKTKKESSSSMAYSLTSYSFMGDEAVQSSDSSWSMECSTFAEVKTLHISSPIPAAKSPFFYKQMTDEEWYPYQLYAGKVYEGLGIVKVLQAQNTCKNSG